MENLDMGGTVCVYLGNDVTVFLQMEKEDID